MTISGGKIIKTALVIFISVISLLLMLSLVYEIHTSKLLLRLFPRPVLSSEVLENYWENPLPTPKPIIDVVTQIKNGEYLCATISASKLWIVGDEAEDIYSSVQASFELYIDGIYRQPIEIGEQAILFTKGEAGSFGGDISACFKLTKLTNGLHSAEVQFSDTHGQLYSYTWAFRVTS